MEASASNILQLIILAGLLSIVYGFFTGKNILSSSPGNSKMQEIASAIQVGAKAYLNRQYKTIAIVGVAVLVDVVGIWKDEVLLQVMCSQYKHTW